MNKEVDLWGVGKEPNFQQGEYFFTSPKINWKTEPGECLLTYRGGEKLVLSFIFLSVPVVGINVCMYLRVHAFSKFNLTLSSVRSQSRNNKEGKYL